MKNIIHLTLLLALLWASHAAAGDAVLKQERSAERVFGSSPPMNFLLYALNPEKMIGLNFKARNPFNYAVEPYVSSRFLSLPVIGSLHGSGKSINLKALTERHPDLILLWEDDMALKMVKREIGKTGVPTLTLPFSTIESMPSAMERVGEAIGEAARGRELADYSRRIIRDVNASVASLKPVRYYYAEGIDGLSTECNDSFHVIAMDFAGGENVHKCRQQKLRGLQKIDFKTLQTYDPDVIIVQHDMVYTDLVNDTQWQTLRAVKSGRIHVVPNTPFNWIDRPPSFMRVIAIQWLATLFHPEHCTIDLKQRVAAFYDLFFHVKLTDADLRSILEDAL